MEQNRMGVRGYSGSHSFTYGGHVPHGGSF